MQQMYPQSAYETNFYSFSVKNAQNHRFFDLYLPRTEIWAYNIESGVW